MLITGIKMNNNFVLTIGGSDPSGGAGIQADIKTFTSLKVYCCAVITSLTIQNTKEVYESLILDGKFVRKQIEKILEDIPISFIKIGMLGNSDIINNIHDLIGNIPIICDTVIYSKSGFNLIDESSIDLFKDKIISKSFVITPNYIELKKLCGFNNNNPVILGKSILIEFKNLKAVLIKGGHINENSENIEDILIYRENDDIKIRIYKHKRFNTKNTHGTGCTLASAITAFLAKNYNLEKAVEKGINYITKIIEKSSNIKIGDGNGPLIHFMEVDNDTN